MTEDSQVRITFPHAKCTILHSFFLKKWTTFTQTQNKNWIPYKKYLVYVKAYITPPLITSLEVSKGLYLLFCWQIEEKFRCLCKLINTALFPHAHIHRNCYAVLPKLYRKLAKCHRKKLGSVTFMAKSFLCRAPLEQYKTRPQKEELRSNTPRNYKWRRSLVLLVFTDVK